MPGPGTGPRPGGWETLLEEISTKIHRMTLGFMKIDAVERHILLRGAKLVSVHTFFGAGIAQSVYGLATGWPLQGSNPWGGSRFFAQV
jgi:hypothetical protein